MIQDYSCLPERPRPDLAYRRTMQQQKFASNYYSVALKKEFNKIYQYDITLANAPEDSNQFFQALKSSRERLDKEIGYICLKGKMAWGNRNSQVPISIPFKDQMTLELRKTKELTMQDFTDDKEKPKLLQILNIGLKKGLIDLNFSELGKSGKFYQNNKIITLHQDELDIRRGFSLTFAPLMRSIFLRVDICTRISHKLNLLDFIKKYHNIYGWEDFIDKTVITRYGKPRLYQIAGIQFNKNPQDKFSMNKKKKNKKKNGQGSTENSSDSSMDEKDMISYKQYYEKFYGCQISNQKQPLLKIIHTQKIRVNNNFETKENQIYLIPQLVSPTGMTKEQTDNRETMKALGKYTKLQPDQRIQENQQMVQNLNKSQNLFEISSKPKEVDGFYMNLPQIVYEQSIKPGQNGVLKYRGPLNESLHLQDYQFVYSLSSHPQRDDGQADKAVNFMRKAGKTYGVTFGTPGFICIDRNKSKDINSWKEEIEMDAKKNGNPTFIIVFVLPSEQKFYNELKNYFIGKLKCPTQFIRRKTLTSQKGAMSAASKICIQITAKFGKKPWIVPNKHPYFRDRNVMCGGLSFSKSKNKQTMAFVGTMNNELTVPFSQWVPNISKNFLTVSMIETLLVNWAKQFFKYNKCKAPDLIIIYKQGLNNSQAIEQVQRSQIPAIKNMISVIGAKAKIKNYNPQVVLVLAKKKISTRYFQRRQNNYVNPESGGLVAEPFAENTDYDFHLVPQEVTQGTATPTRFHVVYNHSQLPQEALFQMTYNQCFNYYNWQGAVRVPACLQNANKLSKLMDTIGCEATQELKKSSLIKKPFFL